MLYSKNGMGSDISQKLYGVRALETIHKDIYWPSFHDEDETHSRFSFSPPSVRVHRDRHYSLASPKRKSSSHVHENGQ
jgi:hypothetical protein